MRKEPSCLLGVSRTSSAHHLADSLSRNGVSTAGRSARDRNANAAVSVPRGALALVGATLTATHAPIPIRTPSTAIRRVLFMHYTGHKRVRKDTNGIHGGIVLQEIQRPTELTYRHAGVAGGQTVARISRSCVSEANHRNDSNGEHV